MQDVDTPYIELQDVEVGTPEDATKVIPKQKSTTFNISRCSSINIRSFWITTLSFWICFFVWFGNIYLFPWITQDIKITTGERVVSKSMLTISALIFRIFIGDLLPKIGPRYCYILIMIIATIPSMSLYFINTSTQYIICNFFIGIIGSSFVITQYHTSQFFDDSIIGLANATSAGWGNTSGGVAAYSLPLLATYHANWRTLTLCSGLLLLPPILLYYFCTIDTLEGNLNYKQITLKKLKNMKKFKESINDKRVWILFLIYAACFGVKTTIMQYIMEYFASEFDLKYLQCALIVFVFSSLNLFARSTGGFVSDRLHKKYGIQARIYLLFLILFFESLFLFIFAFGTFSLGFCVVIMAFFGFCVETASGVTFSITPFIQPNNIGPVYGIVGGGGNFGSFIFSIAIFYFASTNKLSYKYAFMIISLFVLLASFLSLKIKFSEKQLVDESASELMTEIDKLKHQVLYLQDEKKGMVEEISGLRFKTLDSTSYLEWGPKDILSWILSLDDKMFLQYEEMLTKSFTDEGTTGNDLRSIQNEETLSKWGIDDSEHRKLLFEHLTLLTHSEQEGSSYRLDKYQEGGTEYVQ